jgi:hypothetical protein
MYVDKDVAALAEALGNFSSLQEAQEVLLKDKEHYFKDIQKQNYYLGSMEIETDKNTVSVTLIAHIGDYSGTDKFKIYENGEIEYLP